MMLSVVNADLPTKKGDYFEGHMIWDTCTERKPDVLGFEITDVKTYSYFTPVVEVSLISLLHVVLMTDFDEIWQEKPSYDLVVCLKNWPQTLSLPFMYLSACPMP